MELVKAYLVEISTGERPRELAPRIPVQFNPTSLRLAIANRTEGGQQSGRQARQYVGSGSTTLTLELVFDSADEGQTDDPTPVLERTDKIEYFVRPKTGQQIPPRVRFEWARMQIDGLVESYGMDLDHFAADGTPLRAKVSLTIKAQDPAYQLGRRGPGTADTAGAPTPGSPAPAMPGAQPPGAAALAGSPVAQALSQARGALDAAGATLARALDGESLAQLAQRHGLDPAGWRALAAGIGDPLRLQAGVEIRLGAAAPVGLGHAGGVVAGAATAGPARLGLTGGGAGAGSGADPRDAIVRGHALAGAGGVGAGLEALKAEAAIAGETAARRAFEGAAPTVAAPDNPIAAAAANPGQRNQVFALRADPRTAHFGAGVPLRERIGGAVETRANLLTGQAATRDPSLPPSTDNPAVPGWQALPAAEPGPVRAVRHARGCHCGCH
ncbi:hypothetical protein N8I74_15385 [Chitiniphilus purpureus]|uniref:Contractile injection system tube protein N-terminal domain-containing protein n=1 Tax=Chitiniphilus purpureus TaxID=2981137 RepID=A0ABY6DKX3_9NEIS|nr:hypothetical protein [Chitiniphilus sp. CD1]UXY14687.1 hypothetical protein N8I74_15385 [Chitiniphilus sp. CD1]